MGSKRAPAETVEWVHPQWTCSGQASGATQPVRPELSASTFRRPEERIPTDVPVAQRDTVRGPEVPFGQRLRAGSGECVAGPARAERKRKFVAQHSALQRFWTVCPPPAPRHNLLLWPGSGRWGKHWGPLGAKRGLKRRKFNVCSRGGRCRRNAHQTDGGAQCGWAPKGQALGCAAPARPGIVAFQRVPKSPTCRPQREGKPVGARTAVSTSAQGQGVEWWGRTCVAQLPSTQQV